MKKLESLPVQIGEVKIGRAGQSLNAILGSCIGHGLSLSRRRRCTALRMRCWPNPMVLPRKGKGRHVDHAITSLLEMMEIADSERRKVRVFLAGGANMTLAQ